MWQSRKQRAVWRSVWAFVLTLTILSLWGVAQTLVALRQHWRESHNLQAELTRLENALTEQERALLGLAHADSPKARFAGYDPRTLHARLQQTHQQTNGAVQRILNAFADNPDPELHRALVRLEMEWAQTRSVVAEYLERGQGATPSLTTLRAFSFRGQDTIGDALQEFKAVHHARLNSRMQLLLTELAGLGACVLLCFGGMVGLLWLRWGRPARWMLQALRHPERATRYEARLQGSEWAELYQTFRFQNRRLREVEVFMRDLAMGRTPQPLTPAGETDPLVRSSEWLLKRIQQLQAGRREAV